MDKNEVIRTGSGSVIHMTNGRLHREDGPAYSDEQGHCEWWQHGRRHCVTGPAVTHVNGDCEFYLYGRPYAPEVWAERVGMSGAELTNFLLKYK